MPFSVWARGDSSSANNAELNAENTTTTPTTLLTFEATVGGNETLNFNDGSPDPDTVVYVGSDPTPQTFTLEFGGYLPQSNKLADVNGVDLRGAEILVLTTESGDRFFFVKGSDGSLEWFDIMDAFPNGAHAITGIYTCYAAGTLIETPDGPRPVESLKHGDLVSCDDGGTARICLTTSRSFGAEELRCFPMLKPFVLRAGSLGGGAPDTDLTISALHRVLVRDHALSLLFGIDAAFIAVRDLPWAEPAPIKDMTYHHFLCDRHVCIRANGAESESLYPGDMMMKSLPEDELASITHILDDPDKKTAYPCLTAQEAAVWRAEVYSREKRTA